MKAVVLEVNNEYAAVLLEDRSVLKIRRDCAAGDVLDISEEERLAALAELPEEEEETEELFVPLRRTRVRYLRNIAKAAAIAVVAGVLSLGSYMTVSANSTVTIETGGKEIMLRMNHFDRVIGVSGLEDDEELAAALYEEGIFFSNLSGALEKTERALEKKGLTKDGEKPEVLIDTPDEKVYEKLVDEAKENGFDAQRAVSAPAENRASGDGKTQQENTSDEKAQDEKVPENRDDHTQDNQPQQKDAGPSEAEQSDSSKTEGSGNGSSGTESSGTESEKTVPETPTESPQEKKGDDGGNNKKTQDSTDTAPAVSPGKEADNSSKENVPAARPTSLPTTQPQAQPTSQPQETETQPTSRPKAQPTSQPQETETQPAARPQTQPTSQSQETETQPASRSKTRSQETEAQSSVSTNKTENNF